MADAVSSKWGDPAWVQQFRNENIANKTAGIQQIDNYIKQYTDAYALQQQHTITNILPGVQGGMTTDQAKTDPVGATNFLNSGGKLTPAGQDAKDIFINQAQAKFSASKDKTGHISPDLYNKTKEAASQLGIGGDAFDSTFSKSGFVDPKNIIKYNTAEGIDTQQTYTQTRRQLESILNLYNKIPADQKGVYGKVGLTSQKLMNILLAHPDKLGEEIKITRQGRDAYLQNNAPDAVAYENARQGLSAQLKSLAGAGQGSGVKVSQAELTRWANLIPPAWDSSPTAQKNIQTINDEMKATFNTPTGLNPVFLPSKGRTPLSSFIK